MRYKRLELRAEEKEKSSNTTMEPRNQERSVRIVRWNTRSLRDKWGEFRKIIIDEGYDIIGISETWLKDRHSGKIKGYHIFKRNRERDTRGGGGSYHC